MKYLKNTSWLLAEKLLRLFASIIVGVWMARYLGPEKFGLLNYAQSFVWLFATISTLGLDGIIIRDLVNDESKRDVLLGTAFILKFIGACFVFIILAAAVNFTTNDEYTNKLIFLIASTIFFHSFNVIDYYFQSKVLNKYVAYSNIISLLIANLIKITLIIKEAPLVSFVYLLIFESFLLSISFTYLYSYNHLSLKKWNFDFKVAKQLLTDSWPLIISSIIIMIYMRIDQVMIKEMLDNNAVGQYAAAVRLSEAWYFIPMVISSSLFPAIINAKKKCITLYYTRLQVLFDFLTLLAIAIAIPVSFLSNYLINFLYGANYNQTGSVLIIHIWAGLFVSLGVARGKWILNENLQIYTFVFLSAGLMSNIVLNYFLIQSIGIVGAAYATLFSQAIGVFITPVFIQKTRPSFFMMLKSLTLFSTVETFLNYRNKKKFYI